jgi:hypothetical protein
MATGRLGAVYHSTTSTTTVYEVPASTFAVVTLSICNATSSSVNVTVSLSSSTTHANGEYLEFTTPIAAYGVLERTGIVMDRTNGRYLLVTAGTINSLHSVVVGIETSTA